MRIIRIIRIIIYVLAAISWAVDLFRLVLQGIPPSHYTIGLSLFITLVTVLKWVYDEL